MLQGNIKLRRLADPAGIAHRLLSILVPLLWRVYGGDNECRGQPRISIFGHVACNLGSAVAVMLSWIFRSAARGKTVLGLCIVDAKTLAKSLISQFIGRFFAYIVSTRD